MQQLPDGVLPHRHPLGVRILVQVSAQDLQSSKAARVVGHRLTQPVDAEAGARVHRGLADVRGAHVALPVGRGVARGVQVLVCVDLKIFFYFIL